MVNFDDYVLIDLFFNQQNGGGNAAFAPGPALAGG